MRSIPIPPPSNLSTLAPTSSVRSPWHSPVPYLFGGLATVMALIALALFMLACSYWRLTHQTDLENNSNIKEGDEDPQNKEQPKVYQEKILVIMAGDHKPTFLATPSSSSSSLVANHFDKHIGDSEGCHKSHKENGSSQHEQHSQNL
ncbi:protein GLUTAMINE DUMPER 5 [Cajanus cajan]|uniref:Protein GLUTAMINE DUMPER 3 n=1 Tax=Cajanus cajan TaxID=3821 RepID=A0A151RAD0_CAJCA|nr:protein GLUTAMINE DUMPER 5 [Cajanus cajan]KYP39594.1 hypothetical protein KK1_039076 [Cajanus cajan]